MQMNDSQRIAAPRASIRGHANLEMTVANGMIASGRLKVDPVKAMFGGKSAAALVLALLLPIGAAHLCCLGSAHADTGLAHAAICTGSPVR
ncbi:hypothetical protein [Methyloraptor flagellatus]|uniref:Uncharacterized protein n=1 Tax=Methyloraptor flagellatus TaxID=3162530 RepID=A0AAU7X904_9HYPH